MKKKILINLINDYQNEIKKFIEIFERKYKRSDMLKAWREGVIDKEGSLPGEIEYELHGIGCRIYYRDYEVDFDFGHNHCSNGFDLWRLKDYLSHRPDIQKFLSPDGLVTCFNELEREGVIAKIYDQSNLYFFAPKLPG